MEKVIVMGCACVVISSLEPEQIERYDKFAPEALTMDGFTISLDEEQPGCLNSDGATYSKTKSADGKATITILLDPAVEDKGELVQEKIGPMLLKLDELEKQILERNDDFREKDEAVKALIDQM